MEKYLILALALIFWQPIAIVGMMTYHTFKRDSFAYATYLGNLKAWALALWDLVKWKKLT